MKLIEVIDNLPDLDDELVIFIEDLDNLNSDIFLSHVEEEDHGEKIEKGKKYYYLIELFLAKEFLEDWRQTLKKVPTNIEAAKRLYEYAINDA